MKYMLHANTPNVTYFIYTQQEQVLGELFWYVNQYPPPDDASEVQETLAYLEACSLIFEWGFLSHDRIRNLDSEILQNITKGYDYFSGWLTSILKEGTVLIRYFAIMILNCWFLDPKYPHTSSTQRSFLFWQSMFTV